MFLLTAFTMLTRPRAPCLLKVAEEACTNGQDIEQNQAIHMCVLRASGLTEHCSSVRLSFPRCTEDAECKHLAEASASTLPSWSHAGHGRKLICRIPKQALVTVRAAGEACRTTCCYVVLLFTYCSWFMSPPSSGCLRRLICDHQL